MSWFNLCTEQATTQNLIQAFVISNSLLYGLLQKDINKLQRIQNMAARLISFTNKRDHITPIHRESSAISFTGSQLIRESSSKLFFSPTKCSTVLLRNTCLICSTFTFHHGPCGLAQCVPETIFKLSGHVPRPTVIMHLLLPPQYCGMYSLNTSAIIQCCSVQKPSQNSPFQ